MPSPDWSQIFANALARIGLYRAVDAPTYSAGHTANDLAPASVDKDTGGLLVHMVGDETAGGGGGGGTEYAEGTTQATATGPVIMGKTSGDVVTPLLVEADGTAVINITAISHSTDSISVYGNDGSTNRQVKTDANGELQIDVLTLPNVTVGSALPAGTNAIGKLAANDGVDIGDVTINNASGASAVNIQDGGNSITVDGTITVQDGGGAISVDDNGSTLSIDDGAGSITVDGTVSLGAGSASIGILGANSGVDIGDVTINNGSGGSAVNIQDGGNSITVDGSVSIGSALPAGTNAIGKLAANSGVDIGDVDVTSVTPGTGATNLGKAEDAAHSSGDAGVMALAVRKDTAAALAGTDADYIPLITDNAGRLWTNKPKTATSTVSNVTGATTNTSILSADGNRIRWSVYNDATTNMYLKRGATASTTSYSVKIAPQGYYEDDTWTGAVDAVWDTGVSGDCRVSTEST